MCMYLVHKNGHLRWTGWLLKQTFQRLHKIWSTCINKERWNFADLCSWHDIYICNFAVGQALTAAVGVAEAEAEAELPDGPIVLWPSAASIPDDCLI
jgi:hypothetical protein